MTLTLNNDPYRTRKRPAETDNDTHPEKQRKIALPDDLPLFKFTLNLMYDVSPHNGYSLSDWVAAVDEKKKTQSWSDNMTIQKVLLKLQNLPALHSWFSSMADIMTWDEWKIRLLKAFPPADDFSVLLKRAINRKKRVNETFVDYLQAKTELLENVNITEKNAVSCIIASLTYSDIRVSCVARMGNYQSPGELVEYFKKCDEKELLAAKEAPKEDTPQTPEKSNATNAAKTSPAVRPPPVQNNKSDAAKKKRRKCFNCLTIGHITMNCPQNKSPGAAQKPHFSPNKLNFVPPRPLHTGPMAAAQKKKKKKSPMCKFCGKFGHLITTCTRLKAKQFGSPAGPPQSNLQVGSVQPLGSCNHCGDTTHISFNCPRSQNPTPGPIFERRTVQCGYCLRQGHTVEQCHKANKTAERNAKRDTNKQDQASTTQEPPCSHCGSTKHPSRYCGRAPQSETPVAVDRQESCRFCGSQTHLSSACYYSSKPEGFRDNQQQGQGQGYRPMLCTKCYKLGHQSEDCARFGTYRQ